MRTKFIIICSLVALVSFCSARAAEEEYEYEEEPAPPPKRLPARPLVSRGAQALKNKKSASTTTTTTAAPQEEVEEAVEGDYADEQPETSSTTEAPKKGIIKTGIIRPFRSNDDLLATLKKRREDAVNNKHFKPAVAKDQSDDEASEPVQKESKSAPSSSSTRKSKFNKSSKTSHANEVSTEQSSSTAAPARTGRGRFAARN
ncbi:uncharacterized protein LOC109539046 isoform X1 [Dendroctonus ponderosae]|uniref:Uncharacterized protein n=1 Tax=Dendroctonus ponderosae TaxID=77166 RepID=A0AAR5PMH6_DENPD|nr:uncharacterized protein LOC109539046 isoform X1 [Dendroctonus ponderosae]